MHRELNIKEWENSWIEKIVIKYMSRSVVWILVFIWPEKIVFFGFWNRKSRKFTIFCQSGWVWAHLESNCEPLLIIDHTPERWANKLPSNKLHSIFCSIFRDFNQKSNIFAYILFLLLIYELFGRFVSQMLTNFPQIF